MADHENGDSGGHEPGKFLKSLTVTYQGWGDTPKDADNAMLDVMNAANRAYQAGDRYISDLFQIQNEVDPGGGGGPGYLRPSDVLIPGRKDSDD